MKGMSKDLRQVVEELCSLGWTAELNRRNHVRLLPPPSYPDQKPVMMPLTSVNWHLHKKLRGLVRRTRATMSTGSQTYQHREDEGR